MIEGNPRAERVRVLGRAGAGVIDQALVSLANFALAVVVARLVTPTDFGAFSVVFAAYLVALNVARGFATQPLMIRLAGGAAGDVARAAAKATGLALLLGLLGGAVCLVLGFVFPAPLSAGFIALAVALPGLLLQDALRFVLFTVRRGDAAILNDLVWTVVLVPLVAGIVVSGTASVFSLVLCWGAGAAAAALVGTIRTGVIPQVSEAIGWWREHLDVTPHFLLSELVQIGGAHLVQFAVAVLVGLAAAGSLRGAELLFGPVFMLTMGVIFTMVPEAARLTRGRPQLRRLAVTSSIWLGLASAIWSAVLLFLPNTVGDQVLGDTWQGARSILLPVTLYSTFSLLGTGPNIALRGLADARRTLQVSTLDAVITVVCGIVGSLAGGVVGGAWGLAVGSLVALVAWWLYFDDSIRDGARDVHTEMNRPLAPVPEPELPAS